MEMTALFRPFAYGGVAAIAALFTADYFFPEVRGMAACALITFGLAPHLSVLLEANRSRIWDEKLSPWKANRILVLEFIAIFFGIFAVAAGAHFFTSPAAVGRAFDEAYRNSVGDLYYHNTAVLSAGFFLALAYRAAGLTLVLSWNALHWAETLAVYLVRVGMSSGVNTSVWLSGALIPHLLLEVLAYVMAGMAGVFLSKALCKYSWISPPFRRVAWASITLLTISLGALGLAAAAEVYIAQPVFAAATTGRLG